MVIQGQDVISTVVLISAGPDWKELKKKLPVVDMGPVQGAPCLLTYESLERNNRNIMK